jgi:hypothetical protein
MTSLLFRGSVVLSADNIEELLVSTDFPIINAINSNYQTSEVLPGRVNSMSFFLCDSTQARTIGDDSYWFYRAFPPKFYRAFFNKVASNSDLLSSINYNITLMERIIAFYDQAIEDTLAKQEQLGVTYNINNYWGVYDYVYFIINGVRPFSSINTPISFIDTYEVLRNTAREHKLFYEAKYAEIYASGVNSVASITLIPGSSSFAAGHPRLFFLKPGNSTNRTLLRGFNFREKQYKLDANESGLILYGSVISRVPRDRNYAPTNAFASLIAIWPYKYSYEDTKVNDTLIFRASGNEAFSQFNSLFVTGFQYFSARALDKTIITGPLLNKNLEFKKNQYRELPYEYYPDITGVVDITELENNSVSTKTRTKYFFGSPRVSNNLRTTNEMSLYFDHNIHVLYGDSLFSGTRRFDMSDNLTANTTEIKRSHNTTLANGLEVWDSNTPLKYGVRFRLPTNWTEPKLSLWQPGPEDLNNQGSNQPSFPQKFIWAEDPDNPLPLYVRSATHIYESPTGSSEFIFTPTDESSATPYAHWFGGSTQPPSNLRIKLTYQSSSMSDPIYAWIRLEPGARIIPSIQVSSGFTDPPPDFTTTPFTATVTPFGNPPYVDGELTRYGTVFSPGFIYAQRITKADGILTVRHFCERHSPFIGTVVESHHLYTTQHHFSEPL